MCDPKRTPDPESSRTSLQRMHFFPFRIDGPSEMNPVGRNTVAQKPCSMSNGNAAVRKSSNPSSNVSTACRVGSTDDGSAVWQLRGIRKRDDLVPFSFGNRSCSKIVSGRY
jgi:hypothetical protein